MFNKIHLTKRVKVSEFIGLLKRSPNIVFSKVFAAGRVVYEDSDLKGVESVLKVGSPLLFIQ